MEIYIGNIPDKLKSHDLNKVVRYVLMPNSFTELLQRLFNKKGRIRHSSFQVIDENDGDYSVRYAHASIQPDYVARRVIQRLDHLTLQGSSLRAREYVERKRVNDRRKKHIKNLYSVGVYNRRNSERRSTH